MTFPFTIWKIPTRLSKLTSNVASSSKTSWLFQGRPSTHSRRHVRSTFYMYLLQHCHVAEYLLWPYSNTFMSTCRLHDLEKLSPFKITKGTWKASVLFVQTHIWSCSKYTEWYRCLKNLHVFPKWNTQVITTYLFIPETLGYNKYSLFMI